MSVDLALARVLRTLLSRTSSRQVLFGGFDCVSTRFAEEVH